MNNFFKILYCSSLIFCMAGCKKKTNSKKITKSEITTAKKKYSILVDVWNDVAFTDSMFSKKGEDNALTSLVVIREKTVEIESLCIGPQKIVGDTEALNMQCLYFGEATCNKYDINVDTSSIANCVITFNLTVKNFASGPDYINLNFKFDNIGNYVVSNVPVGVKIDVEISSGETEITSNGFGSTRKKTLAKYYTI